MSELLLLGLSEIQTLAMAHGTKVTWCNVSVRKLGVPAKRSGQHRRPQFDVVYTTENDDYNICR